MSEYDLLVHVDDNDSSRLNLAFSNVSNYMAALPGKKFRVVMVLNGPAVQLLTGDHEDLARTGTELMTQGLSIKACQNALRKFGIASSSLWKGVEIVPAGIVEIVRLQHEGFTYIRP